MSSLVRTGSFVCGKTYGGNLVIYSPFGSAKPFVLRDVALEVFEQLYIANSIEDVFSWREGKGAAISRSSIEEILHFLSEERIINCVEDECMGSAKSDSVGSEGRKGKFLSFWVQLTDACNLRCEYCYIRKKNAVITAEIWGDFLFGLEADCRERGVDTVKLKFAGGEPLLEFDKVLSFAKLAKGRLETLGVRLQLVLITNGTLISDEIARALAGIGFSVAVSLDGLGVYNRRRLFPDRSASCSQVLVGIDLLRRFGIIPSVLTVVSDANVEGIEELSRFLVGERIPFNFSVSREVSGDGKIAVYLSRAEASLISTFDRLATLPGDVPNVGFDNISFSGKKTRICGAGRSYLAISTEGDFCSCQMTLDQPVVEKDGLRLGPSTAAESIRKRCPLPGPCSGCLWRYACCGGCKVLSSKTSTPGGVSPFCGLYRAVLPHFLALEGRRIQIERR